MPLMLHSTIHPRPAVQSPPKGSAQTWTEVQWTRVGIASQRSFDASAEGLRMGQRRSAEWYARAGYVWMTEPSCWVQPRSLTGSPSPGDYPLKSLAYLAMRPVPSRTGRAPTIYRATATLSPFVLMASNPHRFTCDINRISLRTHHVQGNRHTLMLCLDGIQSPCTDLHSQSTCRATPHISMSCSGAARLMQAKIACTGTGQSLSVGLPAWVGPRIETYRDCLGVGAPIGLHVAVNDAVRHRGASLQRRLIGHPVWIQCVDVSSCSTSHSTSVVSPPTTHCLTILRTCCKPHWHGMQHCRCVPSLLRHECSWRRQGPMKQE